jgi:glycosyltransferase involved in cell wall biosynthesis
MFTKSILFVCPYPFNEAPSQRFRFEQYLKILEDKNFSYNLAPFLSFKAWNILYKKGHQFQKAWHITLSFLQRIILLFKLSGYDYIFIHREATPLGPPFFEWGCKFIWHKKIIYDFDDAIWLEDPNEKGKIRQFFKWKRKVQSICKWSYKISCGNSYLADYASQFNHSVFVNPTTIDSENLHNPQHYKNKNLKNDKIIIGWTGTHSTLHYLYDLTSVLQNLEKRIDFQFLVIANTPPDINLKSLKFINWNKETEIEDLNQIDIGIMPLTDDIWSKGKCGFKALQYMALAKPVVASPVGVNTAIIDEGETGFLVNSVNEWENKLFELISSYDLRKQMGEKGLQKLQKYYTVSSNEHNFLSLFS